MILSADRHASDGALIRLVDGECSPTEQDVLEEHLARCAECAGRFEDLADLSDRFYETLAAGSVAARPTAPKPTPRHAAVGWLAAAVVLLVVGAVTPLRAWVLASLRALRPAAAVVQPSAVVSFSVARDTLSVVFATTPGRGVLRVEVSRDSIASVTVLGDGPNDEIVVLANGILVRNRPQSTATYLLRVPRHAPQVTVRVGSRVERTVLVGARTPIEIPLVGRTPPEP